MRTAAIVPAAGRGERLGPGEPKALRELAGQPLLVHAVRALAEARSVAVIVVAAPPEEESRVSRLLLPVAGDTELHVVEGGDTRQQSVSSALRALPDDVDVVLVHDAARPLVPDEVIDAVAGAVRGGADDAGLVEHFGRPVMVVPGSEDGFKVTRPIDLALAEAVLARRRSAGVL